MSEYKVSIVIPVYNEEKVIKACLLSITHQSKKPFEVLIVNNNSTDRTIEIARQFPFVTVLHEQTQGIIPARTKGCDEATGDIIARIDADTILSKRWIENVANHFKKDPKLVALGGLAGVTEFSPPGFFWMKWTQRIVRWMDMKRYQVVHMYGHNMAFRQAAWQKAKKYLSHDELVLEDLDLSFALSRVGKTGIKNDIVAKVYGFRFVNFKKYTKYSAQGMYTKKKYQEMA